MDSFTFKEFMNNPTGSNTAFMANRSMIVAGMEQEYDKMRNDISHTVYKDGDIFLIHFKIPSSKNSKEFKVFYDVVIEFTPDVKRFKFDTSINSYTLRFFSNMPSFAYTYFNTLYNNDLIIASLVSKYPDTFLEEKAEIRNPVDVFGYERGTYIAGLHIKHMGLDIINRLNGMATRTKMKDLFKLIDGFERKSIERKKLTQDIKEEERRKNNSYRSVGSKFISNNKSKIINATARVSKGVAEIATVGRIVSKKSNTTKKVGRIKKK